MRSLGRSVPLLVLAGWPALGCADILSIDWSEIDQAEVSDSGDGDGDAMDSSDSDGGKGGASGGGTGGVGGATGGTPGSAGDDAGNDAGGTGGTGGSAGTDGTGGAGGAGGSGGSGGTDGTGGAGGAGGSGGVGGGSGGSSPDASGGAGGAGGVDSGNAATGGALGSAGNSQDASLDGAPDASDGSEGTGGAFDASDTGHTSGGTGGSDAGQDAGGCTDLDHNGVPDCDESLVVNPRFDSGVQGWSADASTTAKWSAGSMSVTNQYFAELDGSTLGGARQCLQVIGGAAYVVYVRVFIASGQAAGMGGINLITYAASDCSGSGLQAHTALAADLAGVWQTPSTRVTTPVAARSMSVRLASIKPFRGPSFEVLFDDVLVRQD